MWFAHSTKFSVRHADYSTTVIFETKRKVGDKRATLYELITARTGEAFTSERRRDHVAYR